MVIGHGGGGHRSGAPRRRSDGDEDTGGEEGEGDVPEMQQLTLDGWGSSAWSEGARGGRKLARKTAASGGLTPNGGHDSLDLGPPSKGASVPDVEEDAAVLLVVFD